MTVKRPERPQRAIFREGPNAAEALALDLRMFGNLQRPGAFGLAFNVPRATIAFRPEPAENPWTGEPVPSSIIGDGIAVLDLRGPIEHRSSWYWDSFEDLTIAIEAALAHSEVRKVVLCIDSPGGVAAGMGETHNEIRRLQKGYGKEVVAYLNQMACSAAYHVASACAEIWMPAEGVAGSIGVILCTIDETVALEKAGVAVRYVTTGARKADLHPGAPVTDEVLKVAQAKVDLLGDMFFEAVGSARDLSPATVKGYQAAVFVGQEAVDAGLADGLASWSKFLSLVRATAPAKDPAAVALGRRGGLVGGRACAEKMTPKQRFARASKAGKASARKRREMARA